MRNIKGKNKTAIVSQGTNATEGWAQWAEWAQWAQWAGMKEGRKRADDALYFGSKTNIRLQRCSLVAKHVLFSLQSLVKLDLIISRVTVSQFKKNLTDKKRGERRRRYGRAGGRPYRPSS